MKRQFHVVMCKTLLLVIIAFAGVGQVSAQSVDMLIAKYLKARGGYEKLKAIKTLRMTGMYQEGEDSFGTYIEWKRPFFRVVVVGVPNEVYREGFNGASWEFAAPSGDLKITEPLSAAGKTARRGAEFDESIIDYREKGHSVESLGREKLNGKNVYHLRVTLSDDWVKHYYLDAKTYLIVALRKAMPLHTVGPDIESLTAYDDYRSVAGVLFPHSFVERNTTTGKVMNVLRWNRIEANVKIDDEQFNPPSKKSPS